MNKANVIDLERRDENEEPLTAMLRAGAQQLIHQAVEAELQRLLEQHAGSRTPAGTAGVVRNGYLPEHDLQTSLGPIPVRIPKVRSRTGEPIAFHSALVAPTSRKTRTLEAALPWLYLQGISTGAMNSAREVLAGALVIIGVNERGEKHFLAI